MVRDFSVAAQNDNIGRMTQLGRAGGALQVGFLQGSALLEFGPWAEKLGISHYLNRAKQFDNSVVAKNEFAIHKISRVYNEVQSADTMHGARLEKAREALRAVQEFSNELSGSLYGGVPMNPLAYLYQVGKMQKAFDDFQTERAKALFYTFTNGKWEIDKAKILKELQKEINKVSREELREFLEVMHFLNPVTTVKTGDDKTTTTTAELEIRIQNKLLQILGAEESVRHTIFGKNTVGTFLTRLTDGDNIFQHGVHVRETKSELKTSYDFDFPSDWEKELEKNHPGLRRNLIPEDKRDPKYWDLKNHKWIDEKDAPKFYKRELTILEYGGGVKKEAIWKQYTDNDLLGGKLDVKVGSAEAHANWSAGMYLLNNKGEKVFSPGVSAEVGVSATAFNAKYDNQLLGNEMLGVNVGVEATALSASAKASADINLLGKNDKGKIVFDPQANIHVGAEAIAGKVEGKAGVNVLGGEVGVKGSVQFGIGAKADFGIKDGVVKCEIGATLGIGFDVGFEVDVGGMVDTAVSWFKDTFGW